MKKYTKNCDGFQNVDREKLMYYARQALLGWLEASRALIEIRALYGPWYRPQNPRPTALLSREERKVVEELDRLENAPFGACEAPFAGIFEALGDDSEVDELKNPFGNVGGRDDASAR